MVVRTWERMWAPYDEPTYKSVLERIRPSDVVLEIGAGDLRLARRLTERAAQVIAWEIQPELLADQCEPLPKNLTAVLTDALFEPVPVGVTTAVLLMRHCQHFHPYLTKLRAAGCERLITNARWGMDVEEIDLRARRWPFAAINMGWYARECGRVGFVPGPSEQLTLEMLADVPGIVDCPDCYS